MTSDNSKVIASAMQLKRSTKRLNTQEFITKAKQAHGDRYDYSLVNYINSYVKLEIICREHGKFEQTAKQHLKGRGCRVCGLNSRINKRIKDIEQVIADFKKSHGDKYNYHKVKYSGAMNKVCIECPNHGDFWQTPADHRSGHGCPRCKDDKTSSRHRKGLDKYLSKFKEVHGDKYDYSRITKIQNSKDVVEIICREHGVFSQKATIHASGFGCQECGGVKRYSTESFIKKCKEVHGGRYDYSKVSYKNNNTKVKVICPEHGVFEQNPKSHINGFGCQLCGLSYNPHKRQDYIDLCNKKGGLSKLYLLRCFDKHEDFYKVGITRKMIESRFAGKAMPYDYTVMMLLENSASFIWDLEKRLHNYLRKYRYQPNKQFAGETECFSQIPEEVISLLNDFTKSNQMQLIA